MRCRGATLKSASSVLLCTTAAALFYSQSWSSSLLASISPQPRPCACHTCLAEGDNIFQEFMKAAPEPFLSQKDTTTKEDFYWWKRLQKEKCNFTFYNATLHRIFQIIAPVPIFARRSSSHCRSCAVVGNSGNLNGSGYGPLIDSHDIIIRMNRGRTKGYEADVGNKTTHHVMYPESAIQLDNTVRLMFVPFKMKDLLWLHTKFTAKTKNALRIANKNLVMIFNPAFVRFAHESWLGKKGRYPSTGFLALALSMHMCDEVDVFGFGADRDGNWFHYYEKLKNKRLKTGPHSGTREHDVIHELNETQKIQFFVPQ